MLPGQPHSYGVQSPDSSRSGRVSVGRGTFAKGFLTCQGVVTARLVQIVTFDCPKELCLTEHAFNKHGAHDVEHVSNMLLLE